MGMSREGTGHAQRIAPLVLLYKAASRHHVRPMGQSLVGIEMRVLEVITAHTAVDQVGRAAVERHGASSNPALHETTESQLAALVADPGRLK